ncbi:hypothetical protein AB1286_20170 [Trinickia sp. NRRL B-1857]|uniref:hypothetical protein n=1 Tax=Trinickia sp. NRRL B-1857 TaxID=3162879 RepID=UPI003D2BCA14
MIGAFKPRLMALLEQTRQQAAVRAMQQAQQQGAQPPGAPPPGVPAAPQVGPQAGAPHPPMPGAMPPHVG